MRGGSDIARLGRIGAALILVLVAFAGLAATGAGAAPHHAKVKGGKTIVSPKRGAVVDGNVASISIRTGRGLRIRLNGRWIPAKEFGRARRGVRTMQASLSHGLRAGTNTLTVKLRRHGHRRRATVRFQLNPPGPLVGAGRDEGASIGDSTQLLGQLEPGFGQIEPGAPPAKESIAWTPIRVPADDEPSCEGGGAKAGLRSPEGLDASFTPRAPGEYVYRLTDGSSSDIVAVKASYKNRMVPIETIVSTGGDMSKRGIKIGKQTYLLSKAQAAPGADHSGLQVLVLKRETLECISNTRYQKPAELQADLKSVDSSDLVIVAMQPGAAPGQVDGKALYEVLGQIGFPEEDDKVLPTSGGSFSGIGVSGFHRGDGDVNILPNGSNEVAGMNGVLAPDQHDNFGFIPTLSEPFNWAIDKPFEPCKTKEQCFSYVGYFLQIQNPRTGKVLSATIFPTGGEPENAEMLTGEMVKRIESAPPGSVVQLIADSNRVASETSYPPSLAPVSQPAYQRLLNAVISIGGTRNAFNRTATAHGSLASSGQTYALVGWKGAKEGEGAEAAAGVYGQSDAPRLIGELRPNRRSLLRPALESEVATHTNVSDVLMWQPTEKWPLEDDPGAMLALTWLSKKVKLGAEPRHEYWEQLFTPATWKEYSDKVAKLEYKEVPPVEAAKFTKAEFVAANTEFANELLWVGKTKEYLAELSEPFSSKVLDGWATAEEIAKKIYAETQAKDSETSLRWVEFTSIMLKLAGPLTGHVSSTLGEIMDLGVWGFGASEAGRPTYTEVSLKATELAGELRKEMESASATYKAMAQVIVSDPAKLKKIGTEANCSPSEASCDPEFSFTERQRIRAGADISRSIRRLAYEKLIPTFYETFKLNRDLYPEQVNGETRTIGSYLCSGVAYPWNGYNKEQVSLASTNLLQGLDFEHGGKRRWWQTLVLAQTPTSSTYHGTPPSKEILEDMFNKVPDDSDPSALGLGMNPEQFLADQTWTLWAPTNSTNPPEDTCVWN
jgi:hypothetical protein